MKLLFALAVFLFVDACSPSQPAIMASESTHQAKAKPADSFYYAKLTFVADQKDYLPKMLGQWVIHTMQRQARLPEETLNVYMQLNEDRTFVAATDCGEVRGNYSVKGTSIRFGNMVYDSSECGKKDQIEEMVRLLTSSVSLYTVNGNMLFLKDNSGNNVFRVTR